MADNTDTFAQHYPKMAALEKELESLTAPPPGAAADIFCDTVYDNLTDELTEAQESELQRGLGKAATVERVLVVGGGGHLFERLAGQLPNAVIPDQPKAADTRGLFKLHAVYTR